MNKFNKFNKKIYMINNSFVLLIMSKIYKNPVVSDWNNRKSITLFECTIEYKSQYLIIFFLGQNCVFERIFIY